MVVAALGAACGSGSGDTVGNGGSLSWGAGTGGAAAGGSATGGAAGFGVGGLITGGQGGAVTQTLVIEPASPVIATDGAPKTLQLEAKLDGTPVDSAVWATDDVVIGTIAPTGLFTANGLTAGQVKVTARFGTSEATTMVTVKVSATQNVGGVSDADKDLLRAGGSSAESPFKWLYPYDKTVFPRGLAAPVLQFGGGAAEALRVTLDVGDFHYEGFYGASNPVRIALPEDVWAGAAQSTDASAALSVSVSKLSGGVVSGPLTQTYSIAQGKLKGSIYYNSYNSKLAGGGAILRVQAGHDAEVIQGGCTVCHSVSAHGNRIATGLSWSAGTSPPTINGQGNPVQSGTIDIAADGTGTPVYSDPDGRKFSFAALTPDGALALTSAVAPGNQIRGLSGLMPSALLDATTGATIDVPSFTGQVKYAVTPQFAPDGSKLAFSWYRDGSADNSHVIATMSYDGAQTPQLFGAPEIVAQSASIIGWPSFTPDAQTLFYHEGDGFDTENRHADIRLVDLATKTVSALETLNGSTGGVTYLPYGEAEEGHLNYEPTVLPLPVGGYYWVVFTSRRAYGNTITATTGKFVENSTRKKLWIAAIDMTGAPGADRSHPAFYLPGQELDAGNMRGFAAFDPCKADGQSCESGADCCGGFCRQTGAGDAGVPTLECVPPPSGCSNEDEKCTTSADCCGAAQGFICINQRCAQPGVK